jgi:broad specificity phosphatase PhoE
MAIELVFETHSTTEDNELGRATGWLPGRLSEQGRVQALQLGQRCRAGRGSTCAAMVAGTV